MGCRSDTPWCAPPADHDEAVDRRGRFGSGGPGSMLGNMYVYPYYTDTPFTPNSSSQRG